MNVLEASEYLIEEELDVVIRKWLIRFDDLCQISFHQLANHIYFLKLLPRLWFEDGLNTYNVVML